MLMFIQSQDPRIVQAPCSINNLIFKPHKIASTFNNYFTSVFTLENTDTLPQVQPKKPLYLLFRKSLDEETVPSDWKMANVSPIHKKGNKKLTSNFRPVSLTSMVGKLLERLINQAIMTHLLQHNLINDTQYGFLPKNCSTLSF